jgi:alpha-galactosidase
VLRFRFRLLGPGQLTKPEGRDRLRLLACDLGGCSDIGLVELSAFNELTHSYLPVERELEDGVREMGPIVVAGRGGQSLLLAYEHGSQANEAFLAFERDGARLGLDAVQGTYCRGDALPWTSPWLEVAAVTGGRDALARAYRRFVLDHLALRPATRRPLICYNTWNRQERAKHWEGKPYLADMNEERMLLEIGIAARMGIDVFVLDTGWYEKTGDWRTSRARFPRGLDPVKAALDANGMRLGLWFGPLHAALSSQARAAHEDCLICSHGKPWDAHPVWETEASQNLCLASRWAEAFADELIRLHRETGVTVFKWDAIGQWGCDAPGHRHGGPEATREERAARYAFLLPLAMAEVVERLAEAVPEAIVDFDVTEPGRAVGLAFLAAGRYFLINNGPYFGNYDLPNAVDGNSNMFLGPGQTRAMICRQSYAFDRWLPANLTLVHYLPDDPAPAASSWAKRNGAVDILEVTLASVVLGHNGFWGDLAAVSDAGVARIRAVLERWRRVRDAVTRAQPRRIGQPGMAPEIHEKLHDGRGVVAIFAGQAGTWEHVTAGPVATGEWAMPSVTGSTEVTRLPDGRARIRATFRAPGARLVVFGG